MTEVDLYVLTWNNDHDLLLSEGQVTEDHTHIHVHLEGSGRTSPVLPMIVTPEEWDLEKDQRENIHFSPFLYC